jgi:Secretion system C-terminal sorting domain
MQDSLPLNDASSGTFSIIDPTNTVAIPFIEDFTMTAFPANGWQLVNPDNNTTWAYQTGGTVSNAPGSTGKSLRFRNKPTGISTLVSGQMDYAITPFYNFTNQGTPLFMTMYHAYAKYNAANDSLIVAYSTDCGTTWKTLKGFSADDLALNSGGNTTSNTSFVPSADSMWVKDTISIDAVAGMQGVQFAFINKTDLGNSLFIDEININNNPVGIRNISENNSVTIFPNPASDEVNINFGKQANYNIAIKNVLGDNVYQTKTTSNLKIETSNFVKGIYFIEIFGKDTKLNKKIIIK